MGRGVPDLAKRRDGSCTCRNREADRLLFQEKFLTVAYDDLDLAETEVVGSNIRSGPRSRSRSRQRL